MRTGVWVTMLRSSITRRARSWRSGVRVEPLQISLRGPPTRYWDPSVRSSTPRCFDTAGSDISIGVVEREAGTSATGLMQAADTTLYWAKADGGDRYAVFDEERHRHD